MSANNPFLNAYGKGGREVPTPEMTQMPALGVPTNVPLVQPPNVIPNNLGDMQRYSKLNQLASALGQLPVGGGRFLENLQKAQQLKAQQEQNYQYSRGLQDATTKAASTRDILSDFSSNNLIPASQNPSYMMGWQTAVAGELAGQYRNELLQARMKNPYADPLQLQDQIKRNYSGALHKIRPEIAYKYFTESALAADKDDEKLWTQKNDEAFGAEITRSNKAGILNVLQAESALLFNKSTSMETLQSNVKTQFESTLKTQYATGIPFHQAAGDMVDSLHNFLSTVTKPDGSRVSMQEKLSILDSIKEAQLPDGNKVMTVAGVDDKFAKAREDIINDTLQQEKLEKENLELERKANTEPLINELYLDAAGIDGRQLKSWEEYLRMAHSEPGKLMDIAALKSAFDSQNASVITSGEQEKTNYSAQMAFDALSMSPAQFQERWGSHLRAGLLGTGSEYNSYLQAAAINTHRNQESNKPMSIPMERIRDYTKGILPHIADYDKYSLGDWSGFGPSGAIPNITKALQSKYEKEFQRRLASKHLPQGSDPETVLNALEQIDRELQPNYQRDLKWIEQAAKNPKGVPSYAQVISGSIPKSYNTPTPANKPTRQAARTGKKWFESREGFMEANQEFFHKRGAGYASWVAAMKSLGKGHQIDSMFKMLMASDEAKVGQPLMRLVKLLQHEGYNTFLGGPSPTARKPGRPHK